MNDAVLWNIENKQLNIKFDSPTKEMLGEVIHTKFDLEDSKIGIYNTSQLDKLLSITSGDLNLQLEKVHKTYSKLIIEDVNYKLNYSLADILLIHPPQKVRNPDDYTIKSTLDSNSISAIIRAKNALPSDLVRFTVTNNFDNEQVLTMIFGDNASQTNKVEYIVPNTVITGEQYDFNVPFNSEMIRVIFANNRDANVAYMSLNIQGLLKLAFEGDNWKSSYYIIRKGDL